MSKHVHDEPHINQQLFYFEEFCCSAPVIAELYQRAVSSLFDPVCLAWEAGSGSGATEEAAWAILMNSLLQSDE